MSAANEGRPTIIGLPGGPYIAPRLKHVPSTTTLDNLFDTQSDEDETTDPEKDKEPMSGYQQWSTTDGGAYTPVGATRPAIDPGYYDVTITNSGLYYIPVRPRTDDLLRFPDSASISVLKSIQDFWEREHLFREYGLPHKRGILLFGPPGCHAAGTRVLLSDGTPKAVEDVTVGDELMGPDSCPRRVLALCRGSELMYRITPVKGEAFVVNASHVLSLQRSGDRDRPLPKILNLTVRDYLSISQPSRDKFKLRRVGLEFPDQQGLPLDPYFLGAWLGDGTSTQPAITTADPEIEQLVRSVADQYGLEVHTQHKTSSICRTYRLSGTMGCENPVTKMLRDLGVLGNKHIPTSYLRAGREARLALLAGIVDTDGGYATANWRPSQKYARTGTGGFFEVSQKVGPLADQIVILARSLGFGVTRKNKVNDQGEYARINIFGPIHEIPTRIARKRASTGSPNKDHLVTGIKSVEPVGIDKFYGFTLEGDHLYLTEDFVVHHNSGKSCTLQLVARDVVTRNGIVINFPGDASVFISAYRALRDIQPETPVVVLLEDFDVTLARTDESRLLNLLDGVENLHKCVFLATTNFPERLGDRVINRPSRFDVRIKVDHPSPNMRRQYMENLVHEGDQIDIEAYVRDTEGMSLAHLKELFVATHVLGNNYRETVERLAEMRSKVTGTSNLEVGPGNYM